MSHSTEVRQAVLGLLVSMLAIDNEVSDDEFTRLIGHMRRNPLFAGMSEDDLSALWLAGLKQVREHGGFEMLARWVVSVPTDLAEATFELIVQAMLADGVYREKEGGLADALRDGLKIQKARAIEIADRVVKAHHAERGSYGVQ